jgi:hypothetical protein
MKHRTEERTRMVPETRGSKTHMVPETYTVRVPVAPLDWDAIALRAVLTAASLAVAGAVTWSTVAIGDLLSGVAPAWTAYLVAGVFDLAWITCMVLEWLSRYDRDRAGLPIVCGWLALALSVTLIVIHGGYTGAWSRESWILGACGGAVSVLAKGMWTVVMRHSAVEMDPASSAWLTAERREMNARLATVSARRQLARTQSRTQAEVLALSAGQPDTWTSEVIPDRTAGQDSRTGQPDRTAGQDSRTGQPDRTAGQDSPAVLDKGQDRTGAPMSLVQGNSALDLSGRLSQRAFVRGLLSADPSLSDADLSAAVRSEYGQDTKADSIRKAIQRARGDLSQPA